ATEPPPEPPPPPTLCANRPCELSPWVEICALFDRPTVLPAPAAPPSPPSANDPAPFALIATLTDRPPLPPPPPMLCATTPSACALRGLCGGFGPAAPGARRAFAPRPAAAAGSDPAPNAAPLRPGNRAPAVAAAAADALREDAVRAVATGGDAAVRVAEIDR